MELMMRLEKRKFHEFMFLLPRFSTKITVLATEKYLYIFF